MQNTVSVINSGNIVISDGIRLDHSILDRFVSYVDATPKTIDSYKKAIRQLLRFFSLQGIIKPTRADILAFKEWMIQDGKKPTTVQTYITITRIFFKWLESEGIYPNIADRIKGVKVSKDHKKDYLTSSQVKAVLLGIDKDSLQGARDFAITALMITGGLRTVEVVRANIEDLRTLGDSTVLYVQGKGRTEKTDYVKISAPVEQAIRAYLSRRGKAEPSEPLFTSISNNSKGGRMSTRAVSGLVKSHMVSAGYDSERLTAHSLRHTAVTLSLLAGRDLAEVQQFARHSNISTTMIYNHALDRAKNGCSDAVSSAIF